MIQELSSLSFAIGKYILAAALMVIFYWFLFREKATFNNCRLYLLSIALVAILISQFSIVVYTPPTKIVEIEAAQSVPIIPNHQNNISTSKLFQTAVLRTNTTPATQPDTLKKYINRLTVMNVVVGIYITVTSVLFILLLIQLFRILALKRKGKLITKDGFQVLESAEILTPFSFYNTIFLSPNLTGSKLEMILKHEQWHIKHRHYLDVFVMEVLVRLFWFNPVLWWVRRELRNVSEFHADRSVLDEGQDLYKYQTVILEEVMENNPYLANGFNNSFTKKRFIMMKNKCHIRFATLRRTLILPFLIGVFSLMCFTTGNSQVKYVVKNGSKTTQKVNQTASDSVNANYNLSYSLNVDSTFTVDSTKLCRTGGLKSGIKSDKEINKILDEWSIQTGLAIKELNKLVANNDLSKMNEGLNLVLKNLGTGGTSASSGQISFGDEFLSSITKEDLKSFTNSLNKMKTNIDKLKKDSSTSVKIEGFQQQIMSLLFNDFFTKALSNSLGFNMAKFNSKSSFTTTTSKSTPIVREVSDAEKKQKELDGKLWREAYILNSNQFKISDLPFPDTQEEKLVRIDRKKTGTWVTFATPIYQNQFWIYFSDGLTIVDKKTKDRYIVRRVENEIPFNQTIIVKGCARKMIEVTVVFPALKSSVELIDILTLTNDFPNMMSNRGPDTEFRNVKISDFSKENTGKVYR